MDIIKNDENTNIGMNIRRIRKEKGIGQTELIQKIDLINKRQELLYISNRKKKVVKRFILPRWKRFFDITFAGIALIVLSPVFLIISLAIRLESKGPVIYKE